MLAKNLKVNRRLLSVLQDKEGDSQFDPFAWPGGYPIAYYMADGEMMCAECLNKNLELVRSETLCPADESDIQWRVVDFSILEGTEEDYGRQFCSNCAYDFLAED